MKFAKPALSIDDQVAHLQQRGLRLDDPDAARHARCLRILREEGDRSHETFIRQYREPYTDPDLPPIWSVSEIITLGQLSQWIDNLRHRSDPHAIARAFGFDEVVVCAFAHHLAMVRNVCAHHGRVWNRRFTIRMKLPVRPRVVSGWFNVEQDSRIYNTLVMLGLMLVRISPDSTWTNRLCRLIESSRPAMPQDMGFPSHWRTLPLWADAALGTSGPHPPQGDPPWLYGA